VASQIGIPIATGERLLGIHEFEMLLARGAAQYLRASVCVAGGISGTKKIAALAEARHLSVIPHNPLSPVSTAACLQVGASIPNLAIQELPDHADELPDRELVTGSLRVEDGFLIVPDAPGIGVELAPGAREKFPPKPRAVGTRLNLDGSVVDQ
jgi:galactonate dehydratase